jgi:dynein heavy chain 1
VRGYDSSTYIQDIAVRGKKSLKQIAMGSGDATRRAESAISAAAQAGKWVLLKNVHLAVKWLDKVDKVLSGVGSVHPNFRMFFSSEINPRLPTNVVRNSRTFIYEAPPGIKASLLRTLEYFQPESMGAEPLERGRLYFLLAWLHAVILERLRYVPIGWSKSYEFGEPDLRAAADTIGQWMTEAAKGRSNLPPDRIPFPALQRLLSQAIYGGRVDNVVDERLLATWVDQIFRPEAFDAGFELVPASGGHPAIVVPEGSRREHFIEWASNLPAFQSPTWIGLPANAEKVLSTTAARELVSKWKLCQTVDDDEGATEEVHEDKASSHGPAWMQSLLKSSTKALDSLPAALELLERTAEAIKDPLFRFFEREVTVASKLLDRVRTDFEDIRAVCAGERKLTGPISKLIDCIVKGQVPKEWLRYSVPRDTSILVWVPDFVARLRQFASISEQIAAGADLQSVSVWLGGLLSPEAYLTATRQAVAQAHGWSLEQLHLSIERIKSKKASLDKTEFLVTDLRFEGARAEGSSLLLTDEMFLVEPFTLLRWTKRDEGLKDGQVNVPLYLNAARAMGKLITQVAFDAGGGVKPTVFTERGIAIVCSSLA